MIAASLSSRLAFILVVSRRTGGRQMLDLFRSPTSHRSSKRVVRLGFIIGFIALIGALFSGLAAYRVHDQELTARGHRDGARDRHSCQPGSGPADRARVAGPRRIRPVSRAQRDQGQYAAAAARLDLCLQDRFRGRQLDRAAAAGRTRSGAQGTGQRRIFQSGNSQFRRQAAGHRARSTSRSTC